MNDGTGIMRKKSKPVSIYLVGGGDEKVGVWFLSVVFNYRKNAVKYRDAYHPRLSISKFVKEER